MTFGPIESSVAGGDPVELYEFTLGSVVYRLCTSEDPYVFGGNEYSPAEISRSSVVVGAENADTVIEVSVPSRLPLVRQYINLPPGQVMRLTIRRLHRSDGGQQAIVLFVGQVRNVGFEALGLAARLSVAPFPPASSRAMPRVTYSGGCNHVLYSGQCSVANTAHRVVGVISAVDPNDARVITIGGIVAAIGATTVGSKSAQVAGGYVALGNDFRSVRAEVDANRIQLWIPFSFDPVGQSVEVFAGCAHNADDCANVFDNIEGQGGEGGYGGNLYVPTSNVFTKGV